MAKESKVYEEFRHSCSSISQKPAKPHYCTEANQLIPPAWPHSASSSVQSPERHWFSGLCVGRTTTHTRGPAGSVLEAPCGAAPSPAPGACPRGPQEASSRHRAEQPHRSPQGRVPPRVFPASLCFTSGRHGSASQTLQPLY